ncbi:MAG: hypothetical protein KGH55_02230 [Nanoarchaeota archaeon]|nr:hypothetical protein [Nanoarchaeota archaeon]
MKKGEKIFGVILLLLFSLSFISANSYNVAPSTAANGTTFRILVFNVSNAGTTNNVLTSVTVNLTASSTASAGNLTNVTLSSGSNVYYNSSGVSFPLIIPVSATITSQTNFTLNFTLSSSASDNLLVGANITAISAGANVSYSALPYSSGSVTTDSLPPYIIFSNLANSSNLSQDYLYLNVSSNDTVSNVSMISIYIYNLTSLVNSSTNSSVNVANAAQVINFTNLADGTYYVNATSNDTYNHVNSTQTFTIRLDTTSPSASASCTPSTVYPGNSVTCSCSGTDATSGINSSATTASSTISAGGPGTYSYTCSVSDYAGNTGSTTASYYVLGYPGSQSLLPEKSNNNTPATGNSVNTVQNETNGTSSTIPSRHIPSWYQSSSVWIWAGVTAAALVAAMAIWVIFRRR